MSQWSPTAIVNGNLSMLENLVMTSVYTVRTDSMGSGKNSVELGRESQTCMLRFFLVQNKPP